MKKNNKRIVIHTGPGKTGSSAIQAWLVSHQSILAEHGVFYPEHELSSDKISSGNLREVLTQQDNGAWKVDVKKVKSLLVRFEASSSSTLLLSSEFFFHNIADLKRAIPSAEFVTYIRNPVELLESNYNQAVKRHSKIHRFVDPPTLHSYFWQYLSGVYNNIDGQAIHLRPYDKGLMTGGNIVSDLLSVLGIELKIKDRNINPSFTFQCLEFKRLLNHFGLVTLEPQVDALLQACDVGERSYSLMPSEAFKSLNDESCEQMQQFIEKFDKNELTPLLCAFKSAEQRPVIEQNLEVAALKDIADYMNDHEPLLFKQVKSLLSLNTNIVIDNPLIFEAFSVTGTPFKRDELLTNSLLKHINQFTVHPSKRGKICFELAGFYEQQGDLENALMFAKGAHYFNPGNMQFTIRLNQIIKSWNIEQRANKEAVEVTPYEPSKQEIFKDKLRKKLKRFI